MAATLLDYKGSLPSSTVGATTTLPGGQTAPITLAAATTIELADLGIFLSSGPTNRVVLIGNIGVNSDTIASVALVTITVARDGGGIYTAQRTLGTTTTNSEIDFLIQAVDFNVAAGFHTYTLNVTSSVAGVIVNGPISFSGTAYSLS